MPATFGNEVVSRTNCVGSAKVTVTAGATFGLLAHHFEAAVTAVCDPKDLDLVRSLGAEEALDRFSEDFTKNGKTYDVILSDLRMPGLGGEALLERLRERGLSDTVIFMTGDAAGAATRLGEAGVPVLLKPVELAEVARAVETRRH